MSNDESFIVAHRFGHGKFCISGKLYNTSMTSSEIDIAVTYGQSKVLFVLIVKDLAKVHITGLRKTALFVQQVDDSHRLGLYQIYFRGNTVYRINIKIKISFV